jgi:hypothetical protein
VATNFDSSWDECPTNLWTLPAFSKPPNMTRDDLTTPVAATTQVELCPYTVEVIKNAPLVINFATLYMSGKVFSNNFFLFF